MTTLKELIIPPDQDGYSVEKSAESVIRIQLDGGAGRYRQDLFGVSDLVSCQWVLTVDQYDYLRAFYRYHSSGSIAFKAKLLVEHSELKYYECLFMPGSLKLTGVKGLAYFCSAVLECTPLEENNTEFDLAVIYLAEQYGYDFGSPFIRNDNELHILTNVTLPSHFK